MHIHAICWIQHYRQVPGTQLTTAASLFKYIRMYNMYNNCTLQGMTYSGACLRQPHVGQLDWSLQTDGSIIEADSNVSVLCVVLFEPQERQLL